MTIYEAHDKDQVWMGEFIVSLSGDELPVMSTKAIKPRQENVDLVVMRCKVVAARCKVGEEGL